MSTTQECLGTNIVSVKTQMLNPDIIFKKITKYSYDNISAIKWYPMEQFTLLTDHIEKEFSPNVIRKIGKAIIPEMKKAGVLPEMSPELFLEGLSMVYHQANRGPNIGDWSVIKKEPKHFIMNNSTMHNCHLEEGILLGGISSFGGNAPRIVQTTCVKKGDSFCTFDITWM